jgi:hypothetical protein
MMMEQLLDPDVNIDLHGGGFQIQEKASARVLSPGNIDFQGDSVYFGAGSSPLSFAGRLSGGLTDDEVIEYIRRNNGALYDRLWGSGRDGPSEPATSLITKHENHSDNAAGVSQRNNLASCGDGKMADPTLASDKLRGGQFIASIALLNSPSSVASFDSSSRDIDLPFTYLEPTSLAVSAASRSGAEPYVLQQMRYVQSLLLSEFRKPRSRKFPLNPCRWP